jgi:hypothetical protein
MAIKDTFKRICDQAKRRRKPQTASRCDLATGLPHSQRLLPAHYTFPA